MVKRLFTLSSDFSNAESPANVSFIISEYFWCNDKTDSTNCIGIWNNKPIKTYHLQQWLTANLKDVFYLQELSVCIIPDQCWYAMIDKWICMIDKWICMIEVTVNTFNAYRLLPVLYMFEHTVLLTLSCSIVIYTIYDFIESTISTETQIQAYRILQQPVTSRLTHWTITSPLKKILLHLKWMRVLNEKI